MEIYLNGKLGTKDLVLVFLQKNPSLKRFILLVLITATLFLFIISKGSYNSWYHAPVFPLLSIICGAGLGIVYQSVYNDQYGYRINSCGPGGSILDCPAKRQAKIGEQIMVCNQRIKEEVLAIFEIQELEHYKNCSLYLVLSIKGLGNK